LVLYEDIGRYYLFISSIKIINLFSNITVLPFSSSYKPNCECKVGATHWFKTWIFALNTVSSVYFFLLLVISWWSARLLVDYN